jgi:type VI secretion system protein ImpH
LMQFPRSAAGLRGLVADRVGAPVEVVQCVSHQVPIPEDQRCALGGDTAQLGETSWLGSHVRDDMGKFRLEIGPLCAKAFRDILPGGSWHKACVRLVRFYCTEPLEFDILIRLDPAELEGGRLGNGDWSRLGCDMWLGSEGLTDPRALLTDVRRHSERNQ